MKKLLKMLTILGLLLGVSSLHAAVKGISVNELEQLRKIGIKIIDIRKPNELKKTGIIPASYRLNFYKKDGTINKQKWLHKFVNLVNDKKLKFVLVSTDGKQAKMGANLLKENKGYLNPYYLKGGFNSWKAKNKPVQKIK